MPLKKTCVIMKLNQYIPLNDAKCANITVARNLIHFDINKH